MDIKARICYKNIMAVRGTAIGVFIIPIVFSFLFGGFVLSMAFSDMNVPHSIFSSSTSSTSLQFVDMRSEYATSDRVEARVSVSDSAYDCGDLYITLFDVSGQQKTAVTQGAFFDQCYGQSAILPLADVFSERIGTAGQYQIDAQLFDNQGEKFLTASHKFTVR